MRVGKRRGGRRRSIADRDPIRAVVLDTAINNDENSNTGASSRCGRAARGRASGPSSSTTRRRRPDHRSRSRSQGCYKACDNGPENWNEPSHEPSYFREMRVRSRLNEVSAGARLNLLRRASATQRSASWAVRPASRSIARTRQTISGDAVSSGDWRQLLCRVGLVVVVGEPRAHSSRDVLDMSAWRFTCQPGIRPRRRNAAMFPTIGTPALPKSRRAASV
jgi:hypothetical protein